MNLTLGFISILISLIIPGIIFRRSYFFGDFSKQFTTNEPLHKALIYSLIPSIVLQFIGLFVFEKVIQPVNFDKIFQFHESLLTSIKDIDTIKSDSEALSLNQIIFHYYLPYTFILYIFSWLMATILSRSVVAFNLDLRFSVLRFNNKWHYLFNGLIYSFNKHKVKNEELHKKRKYRLLVYVDVVITPHSGVSERYSGFLFDFDLDPKNLTNLETLYIKEAHKHKKINNSTTVKKIDPVTREESIVTDCTDKYLKKRIKGDMLVLTTNYLDNLNVIPVYLDDNEIERKERLRGNNIRLLSSITTIIITLSLISCLAKGVGYFDLKYLHEDLDFTLLSARLAVATTLFFPLLLLFTPFDYQDRKIVFNIKRALISLVVSLIFGVITLSLILSVLNIV